MRTRAGIALVLLLAVGAPLAAQEREGGDAIEAPGLSADHGTAAGTGVGRCWSIRPRGKSRCRS